MSEQPPRSSRRRRGYFVPGIIALAVLALIAVVINATGMQHHAPRSLAGPEVAALIGQGIQARDGRAGSGSPPEVRCPPTEPVRAGTTFSCRLVVPGGYRQVRVTETSDQGTFTWKLDPVTPGS